MPMCADTPWELSSPESTEELLNIVGVLVFQGNDLNQLALRLGIMDKVRDSHDAEWGNADAVSLIRDISAMAQEQAVLVQKISAAVGA